MTEATYDDRAPGDELGPIEAQTDTSRFLIHTTGFLLAVVLTVTSFWVANTSVLWAPAVGLGLCVLAIAQMGVHLVFFFHLTTAPDNTNNVLALAFGVFLTILVIGGSMWIMTNLNENLMPTPEVMDLHMQH